MIFDMIFYQYLISLSISFLKISIFSSFSKDFVSGKNVDIFFVNVYAEITDSKSIFDFFLTWLLLYSPPNNNQNIYTMI